MNELYYKINYYHNRFFIINDDVYVYIIDVINNDYIYEFEIKNNKILYLKIKNKNIGITEDLYIKIIYKKKEHNLIIKGIITDYIKIGNVYKLVYLNDFIINNNDIHFDSDYYKYSNKLLNKKYLTNIDYINYHWVLCGRINPYLYFKYLLKKYEELIFKLNIPKINYNEHNNNTLLFIDDRYDPSFIYLARLFLYSVDNTWNITIFTTSDNSKYFEDDLLKLDITGKIILLDRKFENTHQYSKLLKSNTFWNQIKEEHCLLFQYDSFCMKKFNPIFFDYNYIGAKWPHKATLYNINIGNGGTSFRKTRVMEYITQRYIMNNIYNKKRLMAEDIFIAELLYENNLYNCTEDIADMFSFENIFNDNSCYAHQLYNSIKLENMDQFIYNKISNMI